MKKVLLIAAFVFASFAGFSASKYSIDDASIESVLKQSIEITNLQLDAASSTDLNLESVQADKNVWVAVALDILFGGIAIHRVYLGTPPGIIAGYFFTCGGIFGVLPLIDFIVLVINNEDISAYVDKKGLIMFN